MEVGFVGQQVITLKLDESSARRAPQEASDGGWRSVKTDEGEVDIDLDKVAFLRVAASHASVGFGSGD